MKNNKMGFIDQIDNMINEGGPVESHSLDIKSLQKKKDKSKKH